MKNEDIITKPESYTRPPLDELCWHEKDYSEWDERDWLEAMPKKMSDIIRWDDREYLMLIPEQMSNKLAQEQYLKNEIAQSEILESRLESYDRLVNKIDWGMGHKEKRSIWFFENLLTEIEMWINCTSQQPISMELYIKRMELYKTKCEQVFFKKQQDYRNKIILEWENGNS